MTKIEFLDENSGSEDEPSANELRRRRLAALDNLDLDWKNDIKILLTVPSL